MTGWLHPYAAAAICAAGIAIAAAAGEAMFRRERGRCTADDRGPRSLP